jgi:hypothetical protein
MNSATSAPVLDLHPSLAEFLAQETGLLAGRLADLLDRVLTGEGEHAGASAFLRSMTASAGSGPVAGARAGVHRSKDVHHPLDRLANSLGLSPVEVDLLLLAGMPEEHEGYASVLRGLHPRGEPRPTAGLAAQLFCSGPEERRWIRAALETGAAVRSGALRLGEDGPFHERSLLLADSLWPVLGGLDVWPREIVRIGDGAADLTGADGNVSAGLRRWLTGPAVTPAREALGSGGRWTVLVTADSDEVALERAAALVVATGAAPVRFVLPGSASAGLERLVSVHAVARGVVPVIRIAASEGSGSSAAPEFAEHPGPIVVCARAGSLAVRGSRPVIEVAAGRLSARDRAEMWREAVPELSGEAQLLAVRYTVEPEVAFRAVRDARSLASLERRPPEPDDVARSVRTRAGLALSSGVRLLRPTASWDQLVLSTERMAQLREALDRLIHQARVLDDWRFLDGRPGARGVRMLFSGPSGTGKTLSAEVLAGALGVDLLLVDVSRVVSKWIGETEKNLSEVFDVAEHAQAVLFFDEADAIFGRRTEVSDAHDRYANLETAYLLTRLERFEGLAVLATNLRQNIDPAFLRRLEFVLEFEPPAATERLALWRCHLPTGAPIDPSVDLRELAAHFPIVGGWIRNAAVAAAFLAAAEDSPITRSHIVRAVRREYDKSGRAFPGAIPGISAP